MALILVLAEILPGAAAERKVYQVVGKILQSDGTAFRGAAPVVFLHGAITPFSAQALVGTDGQFKLKSIPPGTYTLVADAPRVGEMRKTIEVGPSFADPQGRVVVNLTFDRSLSSLKTDTVSAAALSVPESAMQEYRRAQDCVGRQDIKGATARLRKAVEIAPQFAIAWNQLGTIAYQTKQYLQAEECFREALKQDPDLYAPLVNLGGTLLSQNRIQDALPINQEAVKDMPGDALAHSQLGKNYYYLGQLDDAETHLRRAKALDPSHFSYPQIILIEIYLKKNQLPAAMVEMEEFLKLHPDSDLAPQIRKLREAAREYLPPR